MDQYTLQSTSDPAFTTRNPIAGLEEFVILRALRRAEMSSRRARCAPKTNSAQVR